MLIVEAQNIGGDNFNAKYAVKVRIGGRVVWEGKVEGHNRHYGWPFLLDSIADAARADENATTTPEPLHMDRSYRERPE